MHRKNQRKKQKGFDLIQLGLVVALIGLLMSGALVGVPKLIDSIKTNQQTSDIRSFIASGQSIFALLPANEITIAAIFNTDMYPTKFTSVTDLTTPSRFGSNLVITKTAADTRVIQIDLGIPTSKVCMQIATEFSGLAKAITIGANDEVASAGGKIPSTTFAESCATMTGTPDSAANKLLLKFSL
jgi:type II secretory pathway pseudopilin PulG